MEALAAPSDRSTPERPAPERPVPERSGRATDLPSVPPRRAAVPEAVSPVAVVLIPVPAGRLRTLPALLESLGRSRTAGRLPAAPGSLAVLVVAAEPGAARVVEDAAPSFPFPLRVEEGAVDEPAAVGRAMEWAGAIGAGGMPILVADAGRPVAPGWAYALLVALRDGADLVMRPAGPLRWLTGRAPRPEAISARAQAVMMGWDARGEGRRRALPWHRPGRAGLLAVTG